MALKYKCVVTVGYPEKTNVTDLGYYNSAIIVNADGETIANRRNALIYYNDDKKWALEVPNGFFDGVISSLGNVALGTYKWQATDFKSETSPITLLWWR
jgi:protein N-terminal amidase